MLAALIYLSFVWFLSAQTISSLDSKNRSHVKCPCGYALDSTDPNGLWRLPLAGPFEAQREVAG